MSEEELRMKAVARYLTGEPAAAICRQLGRSERWLLKWVRRRRAGGEGWFLDRSKAPKHRPRQTDVETERLVIETRKSLENDPRSQRGSLRIAWEIAEMGLQAPALRTIDRIVHRNDLTHKPERYVSKGKNYPSPLAEFPHEVHQMDIVGPRFLRSDGRFYSINFMDVCTGKAAINPTRRQTATDVTCALLDTWQRLGMPRFLQMDNQLPFRGSNRYPHSFGIVIRVCLHLGVQPVFIPISEPWRNGVIERFQDVFDKLFFRSQTFPNFEALVEQAPTFETFHNAKHVYSTRGGKSPNQVEQAAHRPARLLAESHELPENLYIDPGQVHLVRFIRSDRRLDIFGQKFVMPSDLVYEYVTATIDTGAGRLFVKHDNRVCWEAEYAIPRTPMPAPR